jgi:hypothetical protein
MSGLLLVLDPLSPPPQALSNNKHKVLNKNPFFILLAAFQFNKAAKLTNEKVKKQPKILHLVVFIFPFNRVITP